MISVEHLSKSFGPIRAVDDVTFTLSPASLTILAGADGAGKSTLLKLLLGLVTKDKGEIFLQGQPITNDLSPITSIAGYMPERFSLYSDLSVEENMNFFADIQQVPRKRREELKQRLLEKTGMLPFKKRLAGALSGGMKQKLSLSTILLSSPEMIILDEPTTGVDPLSRIEFFQIINDLKNEGKTIIASTPYLDEAEKGDHIIFFRNGRVIQKGPIKLLKNQFPAKLFRILPEGNIFEVMQKLQAYPELKDNVYIRGRYIKYIQKGEKSFIHMIPAQEIREEPAALEDIYLYFERTVHEKSV